MKKLEKDINRVVSNALQPIKVVDEYGVGVYSKIYKITSKNLTMALKVSKDENKQLDGIDIHRAVFKYAMSPKIYATGLVNKKSFTIMDPIASDLFHYMSSDFNVAHISHAFKCLLDKKYVLGMLHGDMHVENIVILSDGITLGFIDFDFSVLNIDPILTILDFIPLLGLLKTLVLNKPVVLLVAYLLQYYKDTFNISIKLEKINQILEGGFNYDGKLNSYVKIADKVGLKKTTSRDVLKCFPYLKLPKIT